MGEFKYAHLFQEGPILTEIDWETIPKPFMDVIIAQLQTQYEDWNFVQINIEEDYDYGIILATEKNSKLDRMVQQNVPWEDLKDMLLSKHAPIIELNSQKQRVSWIDIFNM